MQARRLYQYIHLKFLGSPPAKKPLLDGFDCYVAQTIDIMF